PRQRRPSRVMAPRKGQIETGRLREYPVPACVARSCPPMMVPAGAAARARTGVSMGRLRALAAALLLAAAIAPAAAQEWPTRQVSMIVPYAAGGPPDVIARIIAPGMSQSLGVQVVVENVSGAGGITGTSRVARAAPDGYTFLLGAAGVLSQNQTL